MHRLQNNWKNRVMNTIAHCKELYQATKETDLFWQRFEEIGGFAKLQKGYLANRLDMLLANAIRLAAKKEMDKKPSAKRCLVFVDGFFAKELSTLPEAIVLPLSEAYQTYVSFIQSRNERILAQEKSALATFNGAFAQEAAFVYVPADTVITEPVEIICYESSQEGFVLSSPRLQLVVGKHSQLMLTREQTTKGMLCSNQGLDIQLEEGARVEFINFTEGSDEGFLFDTLRATLKANSFLHGHTISKGAKCCIRDYHVELVGENAEAKLEAALSLPKKRQEQIEILMEHKAPHCVSDQHIKHVGYAASRHSFSGTIYVHKAAKDTMSYQKHSALLLDQAAFVAAQPNLEIFTDEVKASHGATAGQISKEQLFYLTSRGLSKEQAHTILIEAHLKEILNSITTKEDKERALQLLGCS